MSSKLAGTGIFSEDSDCVRWTPVCTEGPHSSPQHGFLETDGLSARSRLQHFDAEWLSEPSMQSHIPAQTLPASINTNNSAANRFIRFQAKYGLQAQICQAIVRSEFGRRKLFPNAERGKNSRQHVLGRCLAGDLAEVFHGVVQADEDDLFAHFFS
jgi:hypothetical protein